MKTRYKISAILVLLFNAPIAFAKMDAAQAIAAFNRIRETPAELKLFCEQVKLQGESMATLEKKDRATSDKIQKRINQIHAAIPHYGSAVLFMPMHPKVDGQPYRNTPEYKSIDAAQLKMNASCSTLKN
jgi:hypothetical protein